MGGPMTEEARLEAVQRLLDYAVVESQELDLPQLEHLLRQAMLATEAALLERTTCAEEPTPLIPARARLSLVAGTDAQRKNARANEA